MRLRYIGLLAGVFVVAWWASVEFGAQVDNYSYDEMFRRYQPPAWTPESVVLAIGTRAPNSLYQIAYDYINSHGKDLHGDPLGKYFTHGISHHIGLEVHDANDPAMPLEDGMVISVEPGIYIPEENIGIRIEDMVLVTKEGARVLTGALPREASEIEKALAP